MGWDSSLMSPFRYLIRYIRDAPLRRRHTRSSVRLYLDSVIIRAAYVVLLPGNNTTGHHSARDVPVNAREGCIQNRVINTVIDLDISVTKPSLDLRYRGNSSLGPLDYSSLAFRINRFGALTEMHHVGGRTLRWLPRS